MVLYSIGREYIDGRNKMILIMNFINFNNEINKF